MIYRHYKNKPYKLTGQARHSETLEHLVIYDCLYDNPGGKTWARPKDMFFENVNIDGKEVPRFAPVPIIIHTVTQVSEEHINTIAPIIETVLGEWDPEWFHSVFSNHTKYHLGIAYVDEKPVGFKLGYEKDKWTFYSWLGAVLPNFQKLGIASKLIDEQHSWCRNQGYVKVQTKTQNRYRSMLMLNLKSGFNITGTHEAKQEIKIILEKIL